MKTQRLVKMAAGAVLTVGVIAMAGQLSTTPTAQAEEDENKDEERLVHIGYEIAPVPLNLEEKNRDLVGLGSFIVNAQGDCNACHTGGLAPNFNYANNHNPYFGQSTKTDPSTYLSGGTDFGPAVPPSLPNGFAHYPWATAPIPSFYPPAEYGAYVGPNIITRNLTPDKTGRPVGGRTLQEFREIIRSGTDFDNLHPTCQSVADPNVARGICIPPPVDGSKLQVMPWPVFQNMTDHQIEAIYEYLKAIPCIEGPKSPADIALGDPNAVYAFAQLHNDCGDPPNSRDDAASSHRTRKQ